MSLQVWALVKSSTNDIQQRVIVIYSIFMDRIQGENRKREIIDKYYVLLLGNFVFWELLGRWIEA